MTDPRYPIGPFRPVQALSPADREAAIGAIERLPAELRSAVAGLSDAELDTPYRAGGWTVRQVVHHVADSHVNAYCRFRLAVTEDAPVIKPYEEQHWAELADARTLPVEVSLRLLDALHGRLGVFLRSLAPDQFSRPLTHPASGAQTVDTLLAMYSWHGRHHTAHVTSLRGGGSFRAS